MDRRLLAKTGRWAALLMTGASLAACGGVTPKYAVGMGPGSGAQAARPPSNGKTGTNAPYQVGGIWYVPHEQPHYDETGIASWYGDAFQLKATADGEIFDMNQFSAAHTTLPLPSMVEVTNLDNGRKMVVRVNDRGPFVGGRIIDLSHAAARELGYDRAGIAHVRVRYVGPAPLAGPDAGVRYAQAAPPMAVQRVSTPRIAGPDDLAPTSDRRRPADEDIFADAGPAAAAAGAVAIAVTPLVPRPQPVSVSSLAPLPSARPAIAAAPDVPDQGGQADGFHEAPATQAFRIQAGAFGDQENARRAAAQLAPAGAATIEPFQRGGVTLYLVILPGPADEAEAYAFRDKIAGAGFADARVLRPQTPLQ
ncbi:septal ring lytic transglycosylase RlpA family protein [Phenylobacterium sp.]|uniref:septal ring lytic transglycosylase RlpA family protein n=1 Tax=Phenylobacterium sp. TaxID=1871053 RepID=UPI0012032580|nr:septal ring lytic transglycosylase RlpA family protein [Phenylobacterium sp.]THD63014.1 MAG: septal ring lytic transglycosylase RlpA family protein [Phenylobacterium sp.]